MLKQSCLYLRGITSGYSGSAANNPGAADSGMAVDTSTLTSLAIDGHASGYICGYGSVFMNGNFVAPYSFNIVEGYGWIGNYNNSQFNSAVGVLRHLRIMMDMGANYTHGRDILLMSDGASVTEMTTYGHWGQFSRFLERERYNIYSHTYSEVQAGAYGYNGDKQFFKQFALTIFCLSATSQTLPTQMCNAIANAIKEGISFVVIQKGPGEGGSNFNAIFNQIGIRTQKSTAIVATAAARNRQVAQYGDHLAWNNVGQLHITQGWRSAQGYSYSDTGGARPGSLSGQGGTWIPFWCGTVDINDDTQASTPPFFSETCCVDPGTRYEANFDVYTYPYKPDNWQAGLANKTHSITWDNDSFQALLNRSSIFFHAVGYGVPGASAGGTGQTNPGYTIINGVRYAEGRSYSVYKISKATKQVVERRQFDVHGDGGEGQGSGPATAAAMAAFLNSIDGNYWVLVTMFDEASYNRKAGGLPAAMYRIGATRRIFEGPSFYYRAAYCCFGSPGLGEGNAITEMLKGTKDSDPEATFDVGFNYDANGWPYVTGTNAISTQTQTHLGALANGQGQRVRYGKTLDVVDASQFYGARYTSTFRDLRFKKLPMYETKQFVVSVENPCKTMPLVQSHDWVRRVAMAGSSRVYYPFADMFEYLVMTTDDAGPNELCTSHIMMNWDMFTGVGNAICYNGAGPDHLLCCGSSTGNKNDPGSLYFEATRGSRVWQVYERAYGLVSGEAGRNTNDWQVVWKWNGPGSQGHNIPIDPGYEYIVFAFDRYGELELAERHFIVPTAENLPKWGSNFYNVDFSNSTVFELSRGMAMNARHTKSEEHGWENGIMMIIRRPLFMSEGDNDRTGWQLIFNNNGPSIPRGTNYGITLETNYQYMVLCSTGNGGFSSHHFNGWYRTFEVPGWDSDASVEAESCGRCQWSHDRHRLLIETGTLSTNASEYIGGEYAPVGVFQVYRRPILCWDPDEIEH